MSDNRHDNKTNTQENPFQPLSAGLHPGCRVHSFAGSAFSMVTDGCRSPIPLHDAGAGGWETDGNGGEKSPDPPEWQKLQESLIAGAKTLTQSRGREGRWRRVALLSPE